MGGGGEGGGMDGQAGKNWKLPPGVTKKVTIEYQRVQYASNLKRQSVPSVSSYFSILKRQSLTWVHLSMS